MVGKPFPWEGGAALAQVTRKMGEPLAEEGVKAQEGRAMADPTLCSSPMRCWEGISGNLQPPEVPSHQLFFNSIKKVFNYLPKWYLSDGFSSRRGFVRVLLCYFLTTGPPILLVQ